jgi:serine/threonine protein kinase
VLEKKTLPEAEAKGYIIQVIDAIDYCHRQKIIHRDLKLENVLKVTTAGPGIKVQFYSFLVENAFLYGQKIIC